MFTIAAFYKFTDLTGFADHRQELLAACNAHGVKGTILLASEGVNGTICGTRAGIDAALNALRQLPGCADLEYKESAAAAMAFKKMKVRLKKEIVTIGRPEVNAASDAGVYVEPEAWNDLITADDVAVIDTRNDYEVAIGSFKNTFDPKTDSFRDFPAWLEAFKRQSGTKKLAMYCTGGIRCEKATALAKSIGFEEVYHLKGGILKYLERIPEEQSTWQGDCYVFDDRVSVRHGLEQGDYDKCHACGLPLASADKQSEHYVEGVSCPACWNRYTEDRKARFAERQRQYEMTLSRRRKSDL